jgi:hypothetical protein
MMSNIYSNLYEYQKAFLRDNMPTLVPVQKAPPLLLATPEEKRTALDDINVRHLLNHIEKVIAEAATFTLFEFNDAFTRAQFQELVVPFLKSLQNRQSIQDFKVICDETNNHPEIIESNQFVADIYVKPTPSVNYIVLNFIATRTGVDIDEIAGSF